MKNQKEANVKRKTGKKKTRLTSNKAKEDDQQSQRKEKKESTRPRSESVWMRTLGWSHSHSISLIRERDWRQSRALPSDTIWPSRVFFILSLFLLSFYSSLVSLLHIFLHSVSINLSYLLRHTDYDRINFFLNRNYGCQVVKNKSIHQIQISRKHVGGAKKKKKENHGAFHADCFPFHSIRDNSLERLFTTTTTTILYDHDDGNV